MARYRLFAFGFGMVAVCLLSLGCGNGETPKYTVSGTVSFDGKPVEEGSIVFMNQDAAGQHALGAIQAGAFQVEIQNGSYRVKIESYRNTGKWAINLEEGKHEVRAQYIPKKYNEETTLTHEVQGAEDGVAFDLKP